MAAPTLSLPTTALEGTDAQLASNARKIERLSVVSSNRVIEPDVDLAGHVGDGQILPDELLSLHGVPELFARLTPEQRRILSREEVASITENGLRFEAVLMAGFAMECALAPDVTDPRVIYALHEIGEETRHSRLFSRLLAQLAPTASNPMRRPLLQRLERFGMRQIISRPALLYVLVLGGEEIPDLFQRRAMEGETTDAFLKEVNRYHRMEEARHLAYAWTVLTERWATASRRDRFAVRVLAPQIINGMFDTLVHPGVYETVGLPAWKTWTAVRRSPARVALRHEATRPIVEVLLRGGVFAEGRVPARWRALAGVDRHGRPVGG